MWMKAPNEIPSKGMTFVMVTEGGASLGYRDKDGMMHLTQPARGEYYWAIAPTDEKPAFVK